MSFVTEDTGTETVDDFLAHYGVRGMKWGQRRALTKELKGKDRAARKEDRDKRSGEIDAARNRMKSGDNKRAIKEAKAEYKANKNVVGKVAAKRALNAAREKNLKDYEKGQEYKNGKEVAKAIAIGVGASILLSALTASNR